MNIFVRGRPLRQVQTCVSRDVHILGILYYDDCIIIIEEEKRNIDCFHLRLVQQERAERFGNFYQIWTVGGSRMEPFLFDHFSNLKRNVRLSNFPVHFWMESFL